MRASDAEIIWGLILVGIVALSVVSAIVFFMAVRDAARLFRRWKETMR